MRLDNSTMARRRVHGKPAHCLYWRSCLTGLACGGLMLSACVYQPPQIEPTPRAEVAVHTQVKQALIANTEIDAAAVNIDTEDDAIVLKGFVASAEERDIVLDTARELYPDRAIVNGIEIK